jgi:hypothetical protein
LGETGLVIFVSSFAITVGSISVAAADDMVIGV